MADDPKYDSLEKFFRKKTGNYDIQYNESDWLKVEKELDLRDQKIASHRKFIWMAAASALIIAVLSYITLDNHFKINELSELLERESAPGVLQDTTQEEVSPEVDRLPPVHQPERAIAGDDPDPNNDLTPLDVSAIPAPDRDDLQPETENGARKFQPRESAAFAATTIQMKQMEPMHTELGCSVCSLERLTAIHASDYTLDRISERQAIAHIAPAHSRDEAPGTAFPDDEFEREPSSRISLGFITGPDLSTAGSTSNFTNPGYNLGLTIEYKIHRNLSISTGIVQAEVNYIALGDEYTPSNSYFNHGILPSETDATCQILDIPVKLNLNFLHFENSRFYASAGLSSYIMLNEDYRFSYNVDQPELIQSWSNRTGTNHLMSNASLSVGYELDILQNMSLRAEPYVKLPIREVGWGNVKLFSMGSFISLNYNL